MPPNSAIFFNRCLFGKFTPFSQLLTEALLQKSKETLFIADEPELSLYIEWQRKVISSISILNPNAQIIIATHSPEIVGKFKDKAINMENIIYG